MIPAIWNEKKHKNFVENLIEQKDFNYGELKEEFTKIT